MTTVDRNSPVERYLCDINLLSGKHKIGQAEELLYKIQPTLDTFHSLSPHDYVATLQSRYQRANPSNNNLNGQFFEYVLACCLHLNGVRPVFYQAQLQHVPNASFDLMVYDKAIGPITLSAKTSLRERYKQADFEAFALKSVYRRGQSHLITLDDAEASRQSRKLDRSEFLGLDSIVVATSKEFSALVTELRDKRELITPGALPVIVSHGNASAQSQ